MATPEAVPLSNDTFLTALRGGGESKSQVDEPQAMTLVREEYGKLKSVVGKLNDKVSGVLQKQERDFLSAYRAHMHNVQRELQELRVKVAEAATSLQKNDRIHKLEEERDWYRKEALRLDGFTTAMKKSLKFLKEKLEAIEDDRNWLERQLKASKKQNKLLRAELEIRLAQPPGAAGSQSVSSLGVGGGGSATAPLGAHRGGAESTGVLPAMPRTASPHGGGGNESFGLSRGSSRPSTDVFPPRRQHTASTSSSAMGGEMQRQVRRLRQQVQHERRENQRLRAAAVTQQTERAELEELFLGAVEAVKADIARRRNKAALQRERRHRAPVEEQVDASTVGYEDFTATDRKHVVERLLAHDEVLSFLYDSLFPSYDPHGIIRSRESSANHPPGTAGTASSFASSASMDDMPPSTPGSAVALDPVTEEFLRSGPPGSS